MLTERQILILKEIIKQFTETGEPIGSKTLMQSLPVHVSSATIRNDMAALEKAGLIDKTHSSSGRVPSLDGYRFYLDHLIQPFVNRSDMMVIRDAFNHSYYQMNDLIAESSKILSDLTNYTAIALGPEANDETLSGFRMVPLGNRQVMAVLVTSNGTVESQTFTLPPDIAGEDLEKAVRYINDELKGHSLNEVQRQLQSDIIPSLKLSDQYDPRFIDILEQVLSQANQGHYFVDGRLNLIDYLSNPDQLKSLYNLINKDDTLSQLLTMPRGEEILSNGFQVRIGDEISEEALKNFSLITLSYDVGFHGKGTLALLGPVSMPYNRVFGLLDILREELTRKLTDYYSQFDS